MKQKFMPKNAEHLLPPVRSFVPKGRGLGNRKSDHAYFFCKPSRA